MIEQPGVYEMAMEAYHADPAPVPSLSSGTAHRLITQSPLHAWFGHPRLNPNYQSEEATQFDLGACAHALLLEGEEAICVIEADDWRTKLAKEARAKARFEGHIPVLAHKMAEIRAMTAIARKAIASCEDVVGLELSEGLAERVLLWKEGDVWCRARPDWMSADRSILLDYKSTAGSAEPDAWMRQMIAMGYDLQAAHYLTGNAATGGAIAAAWIFLVQENYPPYACSFVGLDPELHDMAKRKWDFAVQLWGSCLERNKWNGYPNRIAYAAPADWQRKQLDAMTFDDRLELAAA